MTDEEKQVTPELSGIRGYQISKFGDDISALADLLRRGPVTVYSDSAFWNAMRDAVAEED